MSATAFSLPSFASTFEASMPPPTAHTGRTASPRSSHSHPSGPSPHSSRSNSREPHQRHFRAPRPYPESNTRTVPRDSHSGERLPHTRKRPAPSDDADEPPTLGLRFPRDTDHDGDVGMRSDRDQDGDDESSGGSSPSLPHVAVKEEQLSDVEQSPSPPPTPAASSSTRGARPLAAPPQRYAHPSTSAGPQTHFAPTPPASARRVSPPHITLPLLPHTHTGPSSHMTLPPLHLPPPSPSHAHHQHSQYQPPTHTQGYTHTEPMLARKRRRVTISGVAANTGGAPPRPLHRTVLERAGSGYGHAQTHLPAPPGASAVPTTPNTTSGMVSPVVTPGFNMNSPGALDQVRDTIAIRMEQKALIEQRKNGGGLSAVPTPTASLIRTSSGTNAGQTQPPRTQGSPSDQSTHLPANTLHAPSTSPSQGLAHQPLTAPRPAPAPLAHASTDAPTALAAPSQPTQTLAHRRGKVSNKLTIHTPNTSMSSSHGGSIGNAAALGLTGTDRPGESGSSRALGVRSMEVAIRSAPPNITQFNQSVGRPLPTAHRPPPQPTPLKERTVPIRRMHANSTAAQNTPTAPLAIVKPGQPLTLNAPAPASSYIATPTRPQFPPSSQTPHHPTHHGQATPHHISSSSHHGHLTPRTTHNPMRGPASPPISRNAFMAFYDAYAEVHVLRAQMDRMEREMDRRVDVAVREMREELRTLREEVRRGQEGYGRGPEGGYHRDRDGREIGSTREAQGRIAQPQPHLHPHPAARAGAQRSGSASVHQSPMMVDKLQLPAEKQAQSEKSMERPQPPRDKSMDRLHPHSRQVLRRSPTGRVQSSMSPPSRPPSVGAGDGISKTRSAGKGRATSKSPGNKSGSS